MTNLRFGRQINYLDNEDAGLWQLNADLHMTNWLEETGVSFDVLTDKDLHEAGIELLAGWRVTAIGHEYSIGYHRLPDSRGPASSLEESRIMESSAISDPRAVARRG